MDILRYIINNSVICIQYCSTVLHTSLKDENGQKIKVTKYTLLNEHKLFIEIINYGATIISCWVPNALGELEDVILGFDSIEGE